MVGWIVLLALLGGLLGLHLRHLNQVRLAELVDEQVPLMEAQVWIERAEHLAAQGDYFGAALQAAAGLGFEGFGREQMSEVNQNAFPVVLDPEAASHREAKAQLIKLAEQSAASISLWKVFPTDATLREIAWSSDETYLAAIYKEDASILVWESESGVPVCRFRGHGADVRALSWHPQQALLASGSEDGTVRIWNLESGQIEASFSLGEETVFDVAWSNAGDRLACNVGYQIRILKGDSGEEILSMRSDSLSRLDWSPDDSLILACDSDLVAVQDAQTGEELSRFGIDSGRFLDAKWSPDGTRIGVVAEDTVSVWRWKDGEMGDPLFTIPKAEKVNHYSLDWHPTGKRIAVTTREGKDLVSKNDRIDIWDLDSQEVIAMLDDPRAIYLAEGIQIWNRDGSKIVDADGRGRIRIWNVAEKQLIRRIEAPDFRVFEVNWRPDGLYLVGGSERGTHLREASTGRLLAVYGGGRAAWSPDAKYLVCSGKHHFSLRDGQNGQLLQVPHQGMWRTSYSRLAWSPNGSYLACDSEIWNLETMQREAELPSGVLAWSPDGQKIAIGVPYKALNLYPWKGKGEPTEEFEGDHQAIKHLAWNPQGSPLASISKDDRLCFWNVETKTLQKAITLHQPIQALDWNPEGTLLATGSEDGVVRFWDREGEMVGMLSASTNEILDLAWDGEGERILVGSSGAELQVFSAPGHHPNRDLAQFVEQGWLELQGRDYTIKDFRRSVNDLGWIAAERE